MNLSIHEMKKLDWEFTLKNERVPLKNLWFPFRRFIMFLFYSIIKKNKTFLENSVSNWEETKNIFSLCTKKTKKIKEKTHWNTRFGRNITTKGIYYWKHTPPTNEYPYHCVNETILHREDGPAVILPDGRCEWWVNGKRTATYGIFENQCGLKFAQDGMMENARKKNGMRYDQIFKAPKK